MESRIFYKMQWTSTQLEAEEKCDPQSVTRNQNWIQLREDACPASASLGLDLLGSIPITAKTKTSKYKQ